MLKYFISIDFGLQEGQLPVFDFDFKTYGKHVVYLEVEDSAGFKNSKEVELILINSEIEPLADYTYKIDHDLRRVEFDASPSTDGGRVVSNYEFVFESGVDPVSQPAALFDYSYNDYLTYSVTLKVTDPVGRTSSVTKDIRIINFPVPDPGPAGKITLSGVDSDGDGIRDDVQRWLLVNSHTNIEVELVDLANNEQLLLEENLSHDRAVELVQNAVSIYFCLAKKMDSNQALEIVQELQKQVFNTKDRLVKFVLGKAQFQGQEINENKSTYSCTP